AHLGLKFLPEALELSSRYHPWVKHTHPAHVRNNGQLNATPTRGHGLFGSFKPLVQTSTRSVDPLVSQLDLVPSHGYTAVLPALVIAPLIPKGDHVESVKALANGHHEVIPIASRDAVVGEVWTWSDGRQKNLL